MILPALLGIGLLLGHEIVRRIVLVLSVLGLMGVLAIAITTHVWVLAAIAVASFGTYLLLLVGDPGGGRLILGSLVLVSSLVASFLMRRGPGPVAAKVLQLGDQIEGEPVQRVAGAAWRFQVAPQQWFLSKRRFPAFGGGEGVALERAVVRPDRGAVAFLFSTKTGNRGFDLEALTSEISNAWAKTLLHPGGGLPT